MSPAPKRPANATRLLQPGAGGTKRHSRSSFHSSMRSCADWPNGSFAANVQGIHCRRPPWSTRPTCDSSI
jgi:hypothetical protein